MIAPAGNVYQAGTLSGNPLAMVAGISTLSVLRQAGFWEKLENCASRLAQGLEQAGREAGIPLSVSRVGTMFTVFFTDAHPTDWSTAKTCDTTRFGNFFASC
jgi:glutamate-1-semialdehyde 2,1-aminomutase